MSIIKWHGVPDALLPVTVAWVKENLPSVSICRGYDENKIFDGRITGRLNKFATVSISGRLLENGKYLTIMGECREFSWESVAHHISNNHIFNFD